MARGQRSHTGLKLLLDEMFSPAIARVLRDRGYDAVAVGERPEWRAFSDAEVIAAARRERRVVVTANLRDFRRLPRDLLAPGGAGHTGMVLVPTSYRLRRQDVGLVAARLEALLRSHPGEDALANGEAWLPDAAA